MNLQITVVPGLCRNDLGVLANGANCHNAVEVGTDQGVFADAFLQKFTGVLHCVDEYKPYPEMIWDRQFDRSIAIQNLAKHAGRVRLIQAPSIGAVEFIAKTTVIHFVYIDASHRFGDVLNDLEYWWSILPPGGILAGHDWSDWHHYVIRAVIQFALSEEIYKIELTDEKDASWILRKPENAAVQDTDPETQPDHSDRSHD